MRSVLLVFVELAACVAVLGVGCSRAQSLGDLAKKEQERRKAVKGTGKVYTNDDLKPAPAFGTPDTDSTPSDTAGTDNDAKGDTARDDEKGADGKEAVKAPAKDSQEKDEKYWSSRMSGLQSTLERDEAFAEALQVQINALTTDFTNRDDPAQRAVVGENRQKALDQLEQLKTTIEDDKKAIDDFEDDARRSGVPPGWLR